MSKKVKKHASARNPDSHQLQGSLPASGEGLTRRRFLALSAAGLGLAAVRIAGGPSGFTLAQGSAEVPIVGGSLGYALVSVDDRFDPAATTFTTVSTILNHITESLVVEMEPGVFSPNLAESWTVSADATEFTFKLREGVSFSDGTPFNAEAVKFTFDRIVSPTFVAGLARSDLGPYERSDVIDHHTVRVVMSKPYAPFLTYVASSYLGIVSPTAVREKGDAGFQSHPVGTGPLLWREYVPNSHISLVRNPDYHGGAGYFTNLGTSYLDEVVVRIIPSGTVRLGALRSGEVQFAENMEALDLPAIRADRRLQLLLKPQDGIPHSMLMNMGTRTDTGRPAMTAELAVRQAVNFAVDREYLVRTLLGDAGSPAWNFLPPMNWAYDEQAASMYSYDPGRASSILEAAGWRPGSDGIRMRDGERLTLDNIFISRPFDTARAEIIQSDLRFIGIDCRLFGREAAAHRAEVLAGNYEGTSTWTVRSDPDALTTIAHSNGVFNRSRYSNPEVDAWLEQAMGLTDHAARSELYAKVQRKINEDAIGLPFAFSFMSHAQRVEVKDIRVDSRGACTYWRDAWLDV